MDTKTTRQRCMFSRLCCKAPDREKKDDGEWMEPTRPRRRTKTSPAPVGGKDDDERTEPVREKDGIEWTEKIQAAVGEEDDGERTETSQTQTSSTAEGEGRSGPRLDPVQEEGSRTGSQLWNGARDDDAPEENSESARRSVLLDDPDEPKIEDPERGDVDGARDEELRPAAVEPVQTKASPRGLWNRVRDELVVARTKEEESKAMQSWSFALDNMDRLILDDAEKNDAAEAHNKNSFATNNALFDGAAADAHDEDFFPSDSDGPFFNRKNARRISIVSDISDLEHGAMDRSEGGGEGDEGEDEDDFAAHGVWEEGGALMAKNMKTSLGIRRGSVMRRGSAVSDASRDLVSSVGRRDSAISAVSDISDFWNKKGPRPEEEEEGRVKRKSEILRKLTAEGANILKMSWMDDEDMSSDESDGDSQMD